MRRIVPDDIVQLARALLACRFGRRQTCQLAFEQTHAADKFRKATGRLHPEWGDGSLAAWASQHPRRPEPFLNDPDYAMCMRLVFSEIEIRAKSHQPAAQETQSLAQASKRSLPDGFASWQSSHIP